MELTDKKHPIFNNKHEVVRSLGTGSTSKVYLCNDINDNKNKVALKCIRSEFLEKDKGNIKQIEKEIQVL